MNKTLCLHLLWGQRSDQCLLGASVQCPGPFARMRWAPAGQIINRLLGDLAAGLTEVGASGWGGAAPLWPCTFPREWGLMGRPCDLPHPCGKTIRETGLDGGSACWVDGREPHATPRLNRGFRGRQIFRGEGPCQVLGAPPWISGGGRGFACLRVSVWSF